MITLSLCPNCKLCTAQTTTRIIFGFLVKFWSHEKAVVRMWNKGNKAISTLFSFIPSPHQCKGYCIFCWKLEAERGRETQSRRESKTLPGCPPFGIRRSGSAWREQLRYLAPPTPLNLPRPQHMQRGTLGAHPAPTVAPEPGTPQMGKGGGGQSIEREVRIHKTMRLWGFIQKDTSSNHTLILTLTIIFEQSVFMAKG